MSHTVLSFDLDNTLWDVDKIIIRAEKLMQSWLQANAPDSLAHYDADNLGTFRAQVTQDHPDQVHDLSFMRIEVLRHLMRHTGYDDNQAHTLAHDAFEVFFQARNEVDFYAGAQEMLQTLSEQFDLYALTNGNADIQRAGLDRYFRGAMNSAEAGAKKPDPRIFHALNAKSNLPVD